MLFKYSWCRLLLLRWPRLFSCYTGSKYTLVQPLFFESGAECRRTDAAGHSRKISAVYTRENELMSRALEC